MRCILFAAAMLICAGATGNLASAGDIQGQVHARPNRHQKDAVVYIDAIEGKAFEAPEAHAVMDQKRLVFVPHVLPVLVGTTVDFPNSDRVLHNVFSPDETAEKFNLGTWPQGEIRSYTFKRVGSAVMLCNVHPEMEAYVVVLPTPFFSKTDAEGNFRIEGVPPGAYTLKVWQKRDLKAAPQQVTVPEKGSVAVEFTLKR